MILLEITENTPGVRKAEEGIRKRSNGEQGGKNGLSSPFPSAKPFGWHLGLRE